LAASAASWASRKKGKCCAVPHYIKKQDKNMTWKGEKKSRVDLGRNTNREIEREREREKSREREKPAGGID
jgi:hypothetical protein